MSAKTVHLIGGLCVLAMLSACGTTEEAHYSNTELLERPPALAITQQPELEAPEPDESVVSTAEDSKTGMGNRVYLTETTPPVLRIKQPFAGAWNTVGQALKQRELQVTDHEKDKGLYYVAYDAAGFIEKMGSLFKSDDKGPIYLLTLSEDGSETQVTATLANQAEQDASNSQKATDNSSEHAAELLQILYKTMRDELTRVGAQRHPVRSR